MRKFIILFAVLAGCDTVPQHGTSQVEPHRYLVYGQVQRETPAMNLPLEMRMHNYGGGSCVHASTESMLRWNGFPEWADWWRATYSGGEGPGGLIDKVEKAGFEYAYTLHDSDAVALQFFEWCTRTRHGATIFYYPDHSINFVGHHDGYAYLLDNNRVGSYITVPWDEFFHNWKDYGGFALTIIGTPPPLAPIYPISQ